MQAYSEIPRAYLLRTARATDSLNTPKTFDLYIMGSRASSGSKGGSRGDRKYRLVRMTSVAMKTRRLRSTLEWKDVPPAHNGSCKPRLGFRLATLNENKRGRFTAFGAKHEWRLGKERSLCRSGI